MGLFSKLFKKKNATANTNNAAADMSFGNPECQSLWDLKGYMDSILGENRYIAKSEYRSILLDKKKTVEYFGVLKSSGLVGTFCKNNGIVLGNVESTLSI